MGDKQILEASEMPVSRPPRIVVIELRIDDAQALYDHTGTIPCLDGSWPNNVRAELSEALQAAQVCEACGGDTDVGWRGYVDEDGWQIPTCVGCGP